MTRPSYKVLAFDIDDTLAPSKSPMAPEMGTLLNELLSTYEICVISGGSFGQFKIQILDELKADAETLSHLHLMPTCGTQYYRYTTAWEQVYAENFSDEEKVVIIDALNKSVDKCELRESIVYGDVIEDRGSQITYSALGQDIVTVLGEEGVRIKQQWDPDHTKKQRLRDSVASLLPNYEVHIGGGTSIDITKLGIDKAYGMQKLMTILNISKTDVVFYGDRLEQGGNDYPVKDIGIDCIAVTDWRDTLMKLGSYRA